MDKHTREILPFEALRGSGEPQGRRRFAPQNTS